ncbi:MAG: hypothetical protein HS117_04360 [Verrucomicrobiaceae bacterium]|nr:hypothetical protein [Verrucomicrobiaceae bacterium]
MPPGESFAKHAYVLLAPEVRGRIGGCLGALPDAEQMDAFIAAAKREWQDGWKHSIGRYPHMLLLLYQCVAFLKYEGNKFWDAFAAVLGEQVIPSNRQTEINACFVRAANHLGLPVLEHQYVQSAVRHVGIPVRVWRGFVQVCEKLIRVGDDWQSWSDESWQNNLAMWLGARRNLIAFFVDNRDTATQWLTEMIAARQMLIENPAYTLDDIKEVVVLRPEYFEAVPETALFLRPSDPESLFRDRPRLRYQNHDGLISITLEAPRISDESMLPAEWQICGKRCPASTNPVSLHIDSASFVETLALQLVGVRDEAKPFRLRGIDPWALWSHSLKAFVPNSVRELPVGAYTVISRHQITFTEQNGWLEDDDDETRWNVEHELKDGSSCFVTQLQPSGKRASLGIAGTDRIVFAPHKRLELRVFPHRTERFQLKLDEQSILHLTKWPTFMLKVPHGMLGSSVPETLERLNSEYRLFCDENRLAGSWHESVHREEDEFYSFKVDDGISFPPSKPGAIWKPTRTLSSFDGIWQQTREPEPEPIQPLSVKLQSTKQGVIPFGDSPVVRLIKGRSLREDHLKKLWVVYEDYMPWFLLSATQDYATWEEIVIAHEMMHTGKGGCSLNRWAFVKIERLGMMAQRGQRWTDFENRVHFGGYANGRFVMRYAGLTTAIYPVLSQMEPLKKIRAFQERGYPPCLEAIYSLEGDSDQKLRCLCHRHSIRIMSANLWTR